MGVREEIVGTGREMQRLMRDKLGVRGGDLRTVVRKGRHKLPRKLRPQAQALAEAVYRAEKNPRIPPPHPKFVARQEKALRQHLAGIDRKASRKAARRRWIGDLAVNLALFGLVFAGFLLVVR